MRALALLVTAFAEEHVLRARLDDQQLRERVARDRMRDVKFKEVFAVERVQQHAQESPSDVKAMVARQRGENVQIHDGFGALEADDAQEEQRVKHSHDLKAFLQTSPAKSLKEQVARQRGEDIQIHDGFGALESADTQEQHRIRSSPDLKAFLQTSPAQSLKEQVARQRGEDIQIHDGFGTMEHADAAEQARIKKSRDLQALMQMETSPAQSLKEQVARQRGEDIQIHDGFGSLEKADTEEQDKIKKSHDLKAFMQLESSPAKSLKELVARQRGEDIQIHDGFGVLESADAREQEKIKGSRDLKAFLQTSPAQSLKEQVARQRGEDIQIHDGFGALEHADATEQAKIKKSRDLQALMQTSPANSLKEQVARQRGEDIQIHDGFGSLEKADTEEQDKIKKSHDLKAFMQLHSSPAKTLKEQVERQRGEDIQIHDGFGTLENQDRADEASIKKNKSLRAFIQRDAEWHW
jgi:uncharacterized Fe-S cluster protein YjdI